MEINGKTIKFVIQKEWNTNLTSKVDNNLDDVCYCSVDELDLLYKSIDSDDVIHWYPIGNMKFHRKFNEIFKKESYETTDI